MKYLGYFVLVFSFFSSALFSSEYILAWENPDNDNVVVVVDFDERSVEFLEEYAKSKLPSGVKWVIVKRDELPDYRWWPARRIENGKVVVHMDIAREMHMAKIRIMRNYMLEDLDLSFIISLESDDPTKKNEIIEQKNRLRSLPERIDLSCCETPEELANFIPEEVFPIYEEFKEEADSCDSAIRIIDEWKRCRFRMYPFSY